MITPTLLADYFARNVQIIKMQTEGLSHADSLVQLPFRANCLNWVVGHMITNRLSVIKLLEAQPPFDAARVARYARESDPVTTEEPDVLPALPRRWLSNPCAAPCLYRRHSRFTCRVLKPKKLAASFWVNRFSFKRCITSNRVSSFVLIVIN